MLLQRLAYPSRLSDIYMQFGWERTRFSRITRATAAALYDRWKHLLRFDPSRLTPEKLGYFGHVMKEKGCPLDVVVAIIDGTLRRVARPVRNQRILYNGWKRVHALKFHALITPDGIAVHVYGPVEGRRHDETLYKLSGLEKMLDKHFYDTEGRNLFVFGDPAYGTGNHLMSPFKGALVTDAQRRWNTQMSRIREPVEWLFGEVSRQFQYLNYSQNQKALLSPCGLYYLVAILLCNAHTILHYPQIPRYFHCPPPTLREYFHGPRVQDDELDEWAMNAASQAAWGEVDVPQDEDEDDPIWWAGETETNSQ